VEKQAEENLYENIFAIMDAEKEKLRTGITDEPKTLFQQEDRLETDEAFNACASVTPKAPYMRVIYFREFLKQVQGKSRVTIPNVVLDAVRDCAPRDMRKTLLKAGFSSFSEHLPLILSIVNPSFKPIDLNPEVEKMLVKRFTKMSNRYDDLKRKYGVMYFRRKSFIPYPFFCYKVCEEEGLPNLLPIWKVTKSKALRQKHETLYQEIKSLTL
jgi:hypothetical protein